MLKKRILASSMASVMALTSFSVVAFADEAFDPDAQQSVTKEQLAAYLKSDDIKSKIDSSAQEYGTISAANFLRACAFAQKVIDGEYDTYSDVFSTVAFQMVRAERKKLVQYTNVQLNDLVKSYKSTYNTENHLNELTNDLIYDSEKWITFTDKYEEALTMENATDIRVTTDVYEELEAAYKALVPLPVKTKTQTEAAKKAYELAIKKEYTYQPWARGTVSGTGTGYDGKEYSWGALFSHVKSGSDHVFDMYDKFDKGEYKGVTITSNPDIVQAVNDMETGAKVLNSFTCTLEAGTDTKTGTLLRRYHGQLVYAYNKREQTNSGSGVSIAGNTYNDQAVEMLEELATKLQKDHKGDTVQAFTRKIKTAEASWISYKEVLEVAGSGSNDYQYGPWNITSMTIGYDPLSSGTSHSEANKILSAELKVKIDGTVNKGIYVIETVEKNVSGQGTYVYTDTDANSTDDGYFFVAADAATAKAAAEAQIAKLPNPSKYKAVQINTSRTMTLSDYVAVDSTDILDVEKNLGTPGKDFRDAKADHEAKEYALKVALEDLKAEMTKQNLTLTQAKGDYYIASPTAETNGKGTVKNSSNANVANVYKTVKVGDDLYFVHSDGDGYIKAADGDKIAFADGVTGAAKVDVTNLANSTITGSATDLLGAYNTAYDNVYGAWTTSDTTRRGTGGSQKALNDAYDTYLVAADVESFTRTHAEANNVADGIYGSTADGTTYTNCAGQKNHGLSSNFNWTNFGGSAYGIAAHDAITYKREADASVVPLSPSITYAVFLYDQYTARETTSINKATSADTFTPTIGMQAGTTGAYFIKTIDAITDVTTVKGNSTPEWKLIYNYLQYALSDKFDGKTGTLKTRKDVQELINLSYDLVEKTVDTSLFSFSNMDLVDERDKANGWDKNADLLRKDYKDNVSTPDYVATPTLADTAYSNLNGDYSKLKAEYDAFLYSYKDIANDISRIAKSVDATDPNNKALIDAIADVADKMVCVDVVYIVNPDGNNDELADSKALTEDGDFKYNNRNYTTDGTTSLQTAEGQYSTVKASNGGDNQTHYNLKVAYNKMLELVKRKKGDVNNDGKINAADAVMVLEHAAEIKALDATQKSYADMNDDGLFNAADAAEILKLAAK